MFFVIRMTNFAITGFPVVGALLLCLFSATAAPHSDGECSDASASGVCLKSGKSMLQMSSSIGAVHSEGQPDLAPVHYSSIQLKHQRQQQRQHVNDWSIINPNRGCEHNGDGIKRTHVAPGHTLASCQGLCLMDPQCRAIDFFTDTGFCNTFPQPCSTPRMSEYGVASYAFHSRITMDQCNSVKMVHKSTYEDIPLRPRPFPVRVYDFSQFAFEHELPLLRMRLAEMGPYVDEFHIAEGTHDFSGRPKPFLLPGLLDSDQDLAQWRSKIVHHKVNTSGHQAETVHVAQSIKGSGVLLEGDLDEIMSRPFLSAIKHCEPISSNGWNATVQMPFLQWNMGWSPCEMCYWRDATLVHDLDTKIPSWWGTRLLQMPETKREEAPYSYIKSSPYLMVRVDGRPAGWHISWTLDGPQGIANKYLHGWSHGGWTATVPEYLKPHYGNVDMLAKFLDEEFLPNPPRFEKWMTPSTLTMRDLPESVVQSPDKFRVQLGSRLYEMLTQKKDDRFEFGTATESSK